MALQRCVWRSVCTFGAPAVRLALRRYVRRSSGTFGAPVSMFGARFAPMCYPISLLQNQEDATCCSFLDFYYKDIPQTVLALRGSHGDYLVPRSSHFCSRGGCRGAAAELRRRARPRWNHVNYKTKSTSRTSRLDGMVVFSNML